MNLNLKYLVIGIVTLSILIIVGAYIFVRFSNTVNLNQPPVNTKETVSEQPSPIPQLSEPQLSTPEASGGGQAGTGSSAYKSQMFTGVLTLAQDNKIILTVGADKKEIKLERPVVFYSCDNLKGENCVNKITTFFSLINKQIKVETAGTENELKTVWYTK